MTSEQAAFPEDDAALVRAVQAANLPTLMMVMVHLSGDAGLMRSAPRFKRASPQRMQGGLDDTEASELRAQALALLRAFRDGGARLPPPLSDALLHEMMSFSLGMDVPPEYVPLMREDMQLSPRSAQAPLAANDFQAVIIGAGIGGMVASIELSRLGIAHTLIEKNDDVGGTWHENTYPGCRVDLPSHFYTLSFEPNAWSHYYAPREEVFAYWQRIADKYGIRARTRFGNEVVSAAYDAASKRWSVTLRDRAGSESVLHCNAVISAVGQLNRPSIPALPELDRFRGPAFHSARWRHDVDLRGKRVGVMGTGASGMQIVPQIANDAAHVTVFQRSPQWAVATPDYFRAIDDATQWLLAHVPYYAAWFRFRTFYLSADTLHATLQRDPSWPDPRLAQSADHDRIRAHMVAHIERELGERRDLLAKCVPDYPPFGKRMLLDNGWWKTLTRENVELVTEEIARVTETGVELSDGSTRALDVLVFATGFKTTQFLWPMQVTGARGQTLDAMWNGDPRAHLGMTVPGFPNLFMLYGPNTNLAHGGSIIFHAECQAHYIGACLHAVIAGGYAAIDCKPQAHDASNERLDALNARMVWSQPNVTNPYRSQPGRIATISPYRLVDYWSMTRAPNLDEYDFIA